MSIYKSLIAGFLAIAMVMGLSACHNRAKAEPISIIVGVGVGMGVLGYIVGKHAGNPLDAPAMKYSGDAGNAAARCAQTYKSYEPNTGLYSPAPGMKKICPFLQ